MNTTTADAGSATVTDQPGGRQLRRSGDDKMLAGVAGGIARYLNASSATRHSQADRPTRLVRPSGEGKPTEATLGLAFGGTAVLLVLDALGWRTSSATFAAHVSSAAPADERQSPTCCTCSSRWSPSSPW